MNQEILALQKQLDVAFANVEALIATLTVLVPEFSTKYEQFYSHAKKTALERDEAGSQTYKHYSISWINRFVVLFHAVSGVNWIRQSDIQEFTGPMSVGPFSFRR